MPVSAAPSGAGAIRTRLIGAFGNAARFSDPYLHWLVDDLLPGDVVDALLDLPIAVAALEVSGTREINNATRNYFDAEKQARYPVVRAVAAAFQSTDTVAGIERMFGASLAGTCLRIEYAQDTDGFWLAPHTDIGPKKFTMLAYLSRDQGVHCGTDVYRDAATRVKTVPYRCNTALVFVPSGDTWHGFEKKTIRGVRRSMIVNYVAAEWRSREQLPYPFEPVY